MKHKWKCGRVDVENLPHCTIARGNAMIGKTPNISITHRVAKNRDKFELASLKSSGKLSRFMTSGAVHTGSSSAQTLNRFFPWSAPGCINCNTILYRARMAYLYGGSEEGRPTVRERFARNCRHVFLPWIQCQTLSAKYNKYQGPRLALLTQKK